MTEQPKLDELQWKSPEWIQLFGLRTENVLEYFGQSPFFDRTSNNQVLKMQNQFQVNNNIDLTKQLTKMKGIEFIIHDVREPDFWIIRKQRRLSPIEVKPISDYYIIGANIYMSPSINKIMESRLLSTTYLLKQSLNRLSNLSRFDPSSGHFYKVNEDTSPSILTSTNTAQQQQQLLQLLNTNDSTLEALLNITVKQQQQQQ